MAHEPAIFVDDTQALQGRIQLLTKNNTGGDVFIQTGEDVGRTEGFGMTLSQGRTGIFTIKPYHFCDSYRVSTENGIVSIDEDTISYTPADVGIGGFSLNGVFVEVTVIRDAPVKPQILYPNEPNQEINHGAVVVSSDYSAEDPELIHVASRWQVATDSAFTDIVIDVTSETALDEWVLGELTGEITYYVRVQHIGERL